MGERPTPDDREPPVHAYAFDGVSFEAASARLRVDGVEAAASALPLKLLEALCRQPGLLLTRNQLFDLIWPRQIASDEALTKLIFRLRELLGPYAPRVVTVRGRGVRLDATVHRLAPPMPSHGPTTRDEDLRSSDPATTRASASGLDPMPIDAVPHAAMPTVLIVDDTPENIALLSALLKTRCRTRIATSGASALKAVVCAPRPDLILLDVMMPEMDGYETCRRIKSLSDCADIPVIFLTARTGDRDEEDGFVLGAVDYITKPVSPSVVLARVATHIELQRTRQRLQEANRGLQRLVAQRSAELASVRDGLLFAMASLAERGESEGTRLQRTQRIQNYVVLLAQELRRHPRFRHELNDDSIDLLGKSVPLRDLGRIGLPDTILRKTGALDEHERAMLRRCPAKGREIVHAVEMQLGESSDLLRFAREIAGAHAEHWDGSGFPEGLQGDEIPISARLLLVADGYEALGEASDGRRDQAGIVSRMEADRGLRFDPDVLDAFLRLRTAFAEIATLFGARAGSGT